MPEQLKHFFDERIVRSIADDLARVHGGFDRAAFVRECLEGLHRLELTERGRHIAEAMRRHLPERYEEAAGVLVKSLGPELGGLTGMEPFKYLPHVFYVAKYGIDNVDVSMRAQYELTKRFSAEFSVRAFLERHPEAYGYLVRWARDPNVHVRRLVSEGSRPRLPWAPRLRAYQKDPTPVLKLLEMLKDDPELYVRWSVANNLNDIGKDHPEVLVEVARRWWKGASEERRWIVRHALRSLVKRGNAGALALLGFGGKPKIRIGRVQLPKTAKIGGTLRFSVELASTSRSPQDLMVDYVVHFVKANGKAAPKVFKLRKVRLGPGARIELAGRVSFRVLTTRKPRVGRHALDLLVNGVRLPVGALTVTR